MAQHPFVFYLFMLKNKENRENLRIYVLNLSMITKTILYDLDGPITIVDKKIQQFSIIDDVKTTIHL